ncbi:ATP synthase subunit b [bacterium BMS3Abin09]|nr:ATP synthase subunit b [bacterium BMS3Abin09]
MIKKLRTAGILFFVFNLVVVCAAFASEGGENIHYTWKDWLWPVVNFSILMFILIFFGKKPVGDYFKGRTALIEKSLKDAAEAKELAENALREVNARLNNTDAEIAEIIEAAKKSGEKERESIIAEGEHLKEKILEQAKANIDFELQKARETIKSEAALMALELAEKQIKEKLGQSEQETLIDDYIKRLEEKN